MKNENFDYEQVFMGARNEKPKTYYLSFNQDYRLRSLVNTIYLKKGKLLDIGCGGGRITESLPYYFPEAKIYGCDVSHTAISYAKKFGSDKVKYSQIKDKRLPYNGSFFDVCICLDVLEHVPNVEFFLKEVKRVLKKNGTFFLIVPCEGQQFTYTWFFQKIGHGQNLTRRYFGHIHPEFTHGKVKQILEKHGFKIKKTFFSEHLFYQLAHLLIFFLPKIILEKLLGETKAAEYSNAGLIRAPKNSINPLIIVRGIWYLFFDLMMYYPMNYETIFLSKLSHTAWKLHVLVEK